MTWAHLVRFFGGAAFTGRPYSCWGGTTLGAMTILASRTCPCANGEKARGCALPWCKVGDLLGAAVADAREGIDGAAVRS